MLALSEDFKFSAKNIALYGKRFLIYSSRMDWATRIMIAASMRLR